MSLYTNNRRVMDMDISLTPIFLGTLGLQEGVRR